MANALLAGRKSVLQHLSSAEVLDALAALQETLRPALAGECSRHHLALSVCGAARQCLRYDICNHHSSLQCWHTAVLPPSLQVGSGGLQPNGSWSGKQDQCFLYCGLAYLGPCIAGTLCPQAVAVVKYAPSAYYLAATSIFPGSSAAFGHSYALPATSRAALYSHRHITRHTWRRVLAGSPRLMHYSLCYITCSCCCRGSCYQPAGKHLKCNCHA